MEKYVCDCCGGTINPLTMTCEYCGTKYKRDDDWAKPIRIETHHNPVCTYTAGVDISAYDVRTNDPETISQLAVKELARELSKCIAPNMVIEMVIESQRDIRYGGYNIYGTVKVVTPACGADKWRIDR